MITGDYSKGVKTKQRTPLSACENWSSLRTERVGTGRNVSPWLRLVTKFVTRWANSIREPGKRYLPCWERWGRRPFWSLSPRTPERSVRAPAGMNNHPPLPCNVPQMIYGATFITARLQPSTKAPPLIRKPRPPMGLLHIQQLQPQIRR